MNRTKMIGYPFGAAAVASLFVMLLGMCVFGFHLSEWDEWQGRLVGVIGTVAAVAAAAWGVWIALRVTAREPK